MLLLGWAVGRSATPVDTWFARGADGVVGAEPRWLLIFTNWWLVLSVLLACLVVALRRRQWRLAAAVLACPIAATAVNEGLKRLFDRRNGSYLEYPSGHTALLVAVLGMAVVVAAERRRWAAAGATLVSLLGMLGLIACGYHYLTDTVGAALLATAVVCIAARAADAPARRIGDRRRPPVALAAAACVAVATVGAASPASADPVPPVSDAARAAGFVDVRSVVPDALVDLRYATPDNFTGESLYPPDARCLVHESLAPGLAAAAGSLRRQGRTLVFWDCYRPHTVQVRMFEVVPDANWVARPGPFARSHETARSVDATLAGPAADCPPARRLGGVCLLEMGTGFDDFSPRALAFATDGVSAAAAANRATLRAAMNAGGLAPYAGEWWHFDGPGAGVQRPILDVPVN